MMPTAGRDTRMKVAFMHWIYSHSRKQAGKDLKLAYPYN